MKKTIGFIGGGNMGRAMMAGLLKSGQYQPTEVYVFDPSVKVRKHLEDTLGVQPTTTVEDLVDNAGIIVLAVKPQVLNQVLAKINGRVNEQQLVISIAAGVTLAQLAAGLTGRLKLIRVMPNTPALVGAGMAAIATNENVDEQEKQLAVTLFSSFGLAKVVPEHLIDAVVGVSGSGPAYVYLFIEALADSAVLEGMPRKDAYEFAAQTVLGSAKMVLETREHPGNLKDMVCSPAGTTITGVRVLETGGFRGLVMDTVHAVAEKNRQMAE